MPDVNPKTNIMGINTTPMMNITIAYVAATVRLLL